MDGLPSLYTYGDQEHPAGASIARAALGARCSAASFVLAVEAMTDTDRLGEWSRPWPEIERVVEGGLCAPGAGAGVPRWIAARCTRHARGAAHLSRARSHPGGAMQAS